MKANKATKAIEPKSLRESLGYSRKQIADSLGIASSTVAGWENGHRIPSAVQLSRLAEIYSLSPEQAGRLLAFFSEAA